MSHHSAVAVVVEEDDAKRELTAALIEEAEFDVIACRSPRDAIDALAQGDVKVAMLLTDGRLAGGQDGVALARTVEARWPAARQVVTSDQRETALPARTVYLRRPWRAFDVLVQAERASEAA